jgi:hypothetical protein
LLPVEGSDNLCPPTVAAPAAQAEAQRDDHAKSSAFSAMAWSTAAILLLFLGFTHFGVMVCFGVGTRVSSLLAPVALLLALAVGDWLSRREGLSGRWRIAPPVFALSSVILSLFLASCFFDLSWDGQWYHQTAVYQMAHGWNPLREPMHTFSPDLQDWVRHYAKGPWYGALALFETTGQIEAAKAGTWLALVAMALSVFASALDFGLRRRTAALIATLVSFNPVVVCELASYLVDGLLASYLACFVAALFRWIRRPSPLLSVVVLAAAILCINAKLTGLVYVGCAAAAGGLYVLLWRRDFLTRYILIHVGAIMLGAVIFGYNPYVTNTVHRGNPFYPWSGSAAYPGFNDSAHDPNELYETPGNMVGRSRLFRLGFALFGRPGAQPVCGGNHAQLMWPFTANCADLQMYRIHGLRIAGFGPFFSGTFLLGLAVLGTALLRSRGAPRGVTILFAGTIVASLLISTHTWWSRYGPQLWWLPIVAVVAGIAVTQRRATRWTAAGLATLLLVNAALVAFAHFRWEIEATRTVHRQLADLRQCGDVAVDFQSFSEPWSERLRAAGVAFRAVQQLSCDQPLELVSVAPGYPGAVRVCVHGDK